MRLKELREKFNISQVEASSILNIPLRTYVRYEKDDEYGDKLKRVIIIDRLIKNFEITEDKGILNIEEIKSKLKELFDTKYKDKIEFCYLFGSYAKGYQKENSDIDLCVATQLEGFNFAGLSEAIRNVLKKRIDLIRFDTLEGNLGLLKEIIKDGIKIYG